MFRIETWVTNEYLKNAQNPHNHRQWSEYSDKTMNDDSRIVVWNACQSKTQLTHELCIKYSLIKCKSSMLLFDQEICCLRNNRWNLKNHPFNNWSKISFAHYVYYRNAASQNIDASIGNDWKWLSSSFICNEC